MCIEIEIGKDRSVIREHAPLREALVKDLLDLIFFVTHFLPKDPIAPGRHSHFLTGVIVQRTPIIFIGWVKIYLTLCILPEELVLQLLLHRSIKISLIRILPM